MTWAIAVLLLFVAGCSQETPRAPSPTAPVVAEPDLVVVIPAPDGSVGSVVVGATGVPDQVTLDSAYAATRVVAETSRIEVLTLPVADVQAIFGPVLIARPPTPTVYHLYFLVGTDTLTPDSAQTLRRVVNEIRRHPVPEVVTIGHADRTGGDAQNDALSLRRAERIRQEVIRSGQVPPGHTEAIGRGAREATGDAARDRRVEVVVR